MNFKLLFSCALAEKTRGAVRFLLIFSLFLIKQKEEASAALKRRKRVLKFLRSCSMSSKCWFERFEVFEKFERVDPDSYRDCNTTIAVILLFALSFCSR